MPDSPRVSIITPVYNAERFIGPCIQSVLDQTFTSWEQIIVDDGSSDNTEAVVRSFSDPRIKYMRMAHRGLEALRESYNIALDAAQGDLVAVLEGDDAWPKDKLALQVPTFSDPKVVLSWGNSWVVDDDGKVQRRRWYVDRAFRRDLTMPELFRVLTRWNVLSPTVTVIVRRDALTRIGGFQQHGSSLYVDLPTWLLVAATSQGIARFLDTDVGIFRIHSHNTGSVHNAQMRLEHEAVAAEIMRLLGPEKLKALGWNESEERIRVASSRLSQGIAHFQQGDRANARLAFAEALRNTRSPREYGKAMIGYASALTGVDMIGLVMKLRKKAAALAVRLPLFNLALPLSLSLSLSLPLALTLSLSACSDPFAAPSVRAYKAVTTGGDHTCAIAETGEAYCWGRGVDGELGIGTKTNADKPTKVAGSLTFIAITAGDAHTCALTSDGTAYCWGWNAYFQRGNSSDTRDAEPVPVTTTLKFRAISAGAQHTCALSTDSLAYCWGNNRYGQVGDGTTITPIAPRQVVTALKFVSITAGGSHSCARTAIGLVFCWGSNAYGELGVGSGIIAQSTPLQVNTGVRFAQVDAGATHTCGVGTDTNFYCWGSNGHGELGTGAVSAEGLPGAFTPTRVSSLFPTGVAIAAGSTFTCAMNSQRTSCWGRNDEGQLANGSLNDSYQPLPVYIPGSPSFQATSLSTDGRAHACALVDKEVFCWGNGTAGQLGVPGSRLVLLPQRVAD